jgi:Protein of unknown function (DUF3800)
MKLLFLDESGDHSLFKIDPSYPMFVLGGIIVDQSYAEDMIQQDLDSFKQKMFGTKDLILHTADISRNRNGFERLKDTAFRQAFYEGLNTLMAKWQYKVIACAVRKDYHLQRYGSAALDPYLLSLNVLVEQFCFELGEAGGGIMVVEGRDAYLNAQLELAWINLKLQGTEHFRGVEIARRISALNVRAKQQNIAGLQLADLVVSPIGRYVLGKKSHEDWRIIESKFRQIEGKYQDVGLVVLPK